MSYDIFISHASEDREAARRLAEALESKGWSVFWPYDITVSVRFRHVVEDTLSKAKCVIVLWSERSTESRYVRAEAGAAAERGCLIPVLVEDVRIPLGFREIQSARLVDWEGEPDHREFLRVVRAIGSIVAEPQRQATEAAPLGTQQEPQALSAGPRETGEYDVFISYRRETDAQTARLIRAELQRRQFRVFLDVDDLRPGHFDETVIEQIMSSSSFIVILSPGVLDRCSHEEDWLRKEVACALANSKNVVPIVMPGFAFPEAGELPEDIRAIRLHHGVGYSHEFFEATIDKIANFLGAASSEEPRAIPTLAFEYDLSEGWVLKNIGTSPALDVVVAMIVERGGWERPVRVPPLGPGERFRLAWLRGANVDSLGATYRDDRDQQYSAICRHDLTKIEEGNSIGEWPEPVIRRHWNA